MRRQALVARTLAGALALVLGLSGALVAGCAKKAGVVRPTREACQEAFIHVGVSQARAAGMPEETARAVAVAARQVIAGDRAGVSAALVAQFERYVGKCQAEYTAAQVLCLRAARDDQELRACAQQR
ncbi:MAG: hypothetical protein IT370_20245 [Deltaproteobacteria bacterium]|nr:hypothetical protein [Deltaproteobacteria bacterium]